MMLSAPPHASAEPRAKAHRHCESSARCGQTSAAIDDGGLAHRNRRGKTKCTNRVRFSEPAGRNQKSATRQELTSVSFGVKCDFYLPGGTCEPVTKTSGRDRPVRSS